MARIELLGGAYTAVNVIAGAQECIDLYPELNPESAQSPVRVTHYPRPGETVLSLPPQGGRGRGLYTATNGQLFGCVDQTIYYIDPDFVHTAIGTLVTAKTTPVSFADNGHDIFIVDGSPNGYTVNMGTRAFAQTGDPNFLGADRADFLDYFLIFNEPGTPNWYCTEAQSIAFNALFFGTKSAWPDNIVTLIAIQRQVYLLGPYKGEIWTDAGLSPFPFAPVPSNIIEHGCAAKYSAAKIGSSCFWLSQSPEGDRMVLRGGVNGTAERVSTHAIEREFKEYARVDDAIGTCYQMQGHYFYNLHFPTIDKTWVFDNRTELWHRQSYTDTNGLRHRRRGCFPALAYGHSVLQDWATGALYLNDPDNYSDNGTPIVRLRSFPHLINGEFDRVTYWRFTADVDVGNAPGTVSVPSTTSPWSGGFSPGFGPIGQQSPPLMTCRFSRDRGHTFTALPLKPMGAAGRYLEQVIWTQIGMAADGVFEISWSFAGRTALNGAYILVEEHAMDHAVNQ